MEHFLFFKPESSRTWWYVSCEKIQNFSSIFLILCLQGHKITGTWVVNTTIVISDSQKNCWDFLHIKFETEC